MFKYVSPGNLTRYWKDGKQLLGGKSGWVRVVYVVLRLVGMLSARKAAVVWVFLAFDRVLTAQTPLSGHAPLSFHLGVENDFGQWDLGDAPAVNATGHLVFETANSPLQHWANSRYRIGQTIVPGTIPVANRSF
ncbi:hypothetical protein BD769DRAFT_1392806 [Suillus cothurnatus]|nr:hypothetical protein BD769DRAFT_1392806 [Suillus cothurnatus]